MARKLNTLIINKFLIAQVLVLFVVSVFFGLLLGFDQALAAIFGSFIAIGNTLLQKWRLFGVRKKGRSDTKKDLNKVYRCMIERWLWTLAMFALGFGLLKLTAFALLISFVLTQGVLFFVHKH